MMCDLLKTYEYDYFKVAKIASCVTGEVLYYPYCYSEKRGRCWWNDWYADGHTVGAIVYVSTPYKRLENAKNAARRELMLCRYECDNCHYDKDWGFPGHDVPCPKCGAITFVV